MSPPHMETPGSPLSLIEHLEELRRRAWISLATFLLCVGVSFFYVEPIIVWLRRPAESYISHFAFFSPTEALSAYFKVATVSGLILSMPVLLWQVWIFVRPALTRREQAYGMAFVSWASFLFIGGLAFAYYFLLPASLRFLLGIGKEFLVPLISVHQYVSFVVSLALMCGIIFELPVVLLLLSKVGIVSAPWLRQQRPLAILGMVIAAALITPTTDLVNLTLVTIPMIILYELSILFTLVCTFPISPISQRR